MITLYVKSMFYIQLQVLMYSGFLLVICQICTVWGFTLSPCATESPPTLSRKTFPATLNERSTGAEDAGIAK